VAVISAVLGAPDTQKAARQLSEEISRRMSINAQEEQEEGAGEDHPVGGR